MKLESGSDELLFRFTEVKGKFWIEAWVDDKAKNKWIERDVIGNTLFEQIEQIRRKYNVPDAYNQLLELVRGDYSSETPGTKKEYPIHFRLGNAGVHEVHMAITPVETKDKSPWTIRYEIVLRRNKADQVVSLGRITSDDPKMKDKWAYNQEFNRLLGVFDVALPEPARTSEAAKPQR